MSACCCMGPQNGEPLCPCRMAVLNKKPMSMLSSGPLDLATLGGDAEYMASVTRLGELVSKPPAPVDVEREAIAMSGQSHPSAPGWENLDEGIKNGYRQIARDNLRQKNAVPSFTLQEVANALAWVAWSSHPQGYDYFKRVNDYILARLAAAEGRCATCDGTGDVHRIDGEWLGPCPHGCKVAFDPPFCSVCGFDCAGANPPVANCPMRVLVPSLPGNWPEDASHENGDYECLCYICQKPFYGHKRRVVCKVCASPASKEKS